MKSITSVSFHLDKDEILGLSKALKVLAEAKGRPDMIPYYSKKEKKRKYQESGYDHPNIVIETSDSKITIWKIE